MKQMTNYLDIVITKQPRLGVMDEVCHALGLHSVGFVVGIQYVIIQPHTNPVDPIFTVSLINFIALAGRYTTSHYYTRSFCCYGCRVLHTRWNRRKRIWSMWQRTLLLCSYELRPEAESQVSSILGQVDEFTLLL